MAHFSLRFIELFKKKNTHLNRNIITYLICVAIASILWFLNTLNKEYTADFIYPVKYVNFPVGKYSVASLPSKLQLEVKAKGFSLLGYRARTSFSPISFNVGAYMNHMQKKNNLLEYTLHTNDIKEKLSDQLSSDVKLLNIYPEEILFKFAYSKSKKVAIRPVVNYTLKRQYILSKMSVTPDSITVSGPATQIDTLQSIPTVRLHLKDIGKNISRTTELAEMSNYTFENIPVEITLQVEQFTEVKKTMQIIPLNVPDSMNIRLFPANVNISYEVGLSKYDQISGNDFLFSVEYPSSTGVSYLEIKVDKAPGFINNLSYSPRKVEYILEKK
ncbi:MAG: YbbR-like domain-containing protein [Odoribacter sp.]